jgi:hypothetical protein
MCVIWVFPTLGYWLLLLIGGDFDLGRAPRMECPTIRRLMPFLSYVHEIGKTIGRKIIVGEKRGGDESSS